MSMELEKSQYSYQYIDTQNNTSYVFYFSNDELVCTYSHMEKSEYIELVFILPFVATEEGYLNLCNTIKGYSQDPDKKKSDIFKQFFEKFLSDLDESDILKQDKNYTKIVNNPVFKILLTKKKYKSIKSLNGTNNDKYSKHLSYLKDKWISILIDDRYKKYMTQGKYSTYLREPEFELAEELKRSTDTLVEQKKESIAKFYAKQYNLRDALKMLMQKCCAYYVYAVSYIVFFCLLLLCHTSLRNDYFESILQWGFPFFILSLLVYSIFTKLNPFPLLVPRLFFSILLGWILIVTAPELFKGGLEISMPQKIALNIVLLITVLLYLYTDIRNKLSSVFSSAEIIWRSFVVTFYAITVSFVQGFILVQLYLQNYIQAIVEEGKGSNIAFFQKLSSHSISKSHFDYHGFFDVTFYYNGEVLFSFILIPVLIGIVVQTIWEDRPITEAI